MRISISPKIKLSIAVLLLLFAQKNFAQTKPDTTNKAAQHAQKNIIGIGFLSLLNNHISLQYDRLIKNNLVFSSQIGVIGPTISQTPSNASGGFLDAGIKLFLSPDYISNGKLRYDAMQGWYFKPQLNLSIFKETYTYETYSYYITTPVTTNLSYTCLGLLLNMGHQWVIDHLITLDIYGGVGYNLTNSSNNSLTSLHPNSVTNFYSYETVSSSFPLAFGGGFNLGILF